ncbi:nucleotidyltransferase family protein [Dermatobacter hominis]|uniref:nucleotidyltransferase family protein n=1 Tax=Dermatobacter hominis TaxID=2884263 RepID=UPI001D1277EB|nr:sugar phosphate nucleotidyltransferase [Dermatobacter hominis]UDY36018.1 NTP transferase domain-containing protein [Dermatobacter hominis]
MADSLAERARGVVLAGVVLSAGEGRRLRPLTDLRPKPLCPMGATTLLDRAVAQVGAVTGTPVAVNVHHGRDAMLAHLADRHDVHVSEEEPEALGTAGALAALVDFLDGRSALVVNADTVHAEDLRAFVAGWDGRRVRVLATPPPGAPDEPFGPRSGIVASIAPWDLVRELSAEPSGLWEVLWRPQLEAGALDAVAATGPVVDCGTPEQYLAANLWLSGGRPVIGQGAVVRGTVERSVVWPGAVVGPDEHLVDAIRADAHHTVLVRPAEI